MNEREADADVPPVTREQLATDQATLGQALRAAATYRAACPDCGGPIAADQLLCTGCHLARAGHDD